MAGRFFPSKVTVQFTREPLVCQNLLAKQKPDLRTPMLWSACLSQTIAQQPAADSHRENTLNSNLK
jgi:hypothetical protein